MVNYELRISSPTTGIWGDWMDAKNNDEVAKLFSKHIRSVRYEYKDGSVIEYQIKER